MTQEEKAKAYDEAIERAKKWRNAPNADKIPTFANRVIDEIFPELKESENERIRKAILDYLTKMWGNSQDDVCGVHVEDAIAWLEKQGTSYTKRDVDDAYVEGMAFAKYELEKQGEQKSINVSIKEKAHQIAWETSKHYDPLLSKECWCEMAALDMASWLKKHGEQKTAWSEDDETIADNLAWAIANDKIRPQDRYTWKPSEEQLEALKNAIHLKPFENPSDSLLWGLYEQLKKLREE